MAVSGSATHVPLPCVLVVDTSGWASMLRKRMRVRAIRFHGIGKVRPCRIRLGKQEYLSSCFSRGGSGSGEKDFGQEKDHCSHSPSEGCN